MCVFELVHDILSRLSSAILDAIQEIPSLEIPFHIAQALSSALCLVLELVELLSRQLGRVALERVPVELALL